MSRLAAEQSAAHLAWNRAVPQRDRIFAEDNPFFRPRFDALPGYRPLAD